MTQIEISGTRPRMGRKKLWSESLRLPLAEGTIARLDAALVPGEDRVSMIREAIERELKRRAKTARTQT